MPILGHGIDIVETARIRKLVELHGQHEHQTLLDPQSHLSILDEFAGLAPSRDRTAAAFRRWKQLQSEFDAFQMDEREKAARLDLLTFQVGELEKYLCLGYPKDHPPVTFRRYTGQENDEQRRQIIADPPDILLTNYVMLELL